MNEHYPRGWRRGIDATHEHNGKMLICIDGTRRTADTADSLRPATRAGNRLAWAAGFAALAFAWAAAPLQAQQTPQVITLETAIAIALERNPTMRQAENAARSSELNVLQQERQLLPTLNFSTGTVAPYGVVGGQPDPTITAGLSTNIQIGNIYSTVANLRQARLNETGSEYSLERSRQTVILNVLSNYLALIEAEEQNEVQVRNLAAVEAQEAQIAAFVREGRRPISDLYQAQASTASARLGLVQAQRGLIVTRMNVIRTLQLDPFGEYDFVVPELGPLSTSFESLDLQAMSAQAFAQRPDLQASQLSLSAAEQGVRIASANRWPSLSLQLGYNTGSYSSALPGNFFNQLDQGRRGNLSLNVSVPILNFTQGINQERARISLDNARIGLENTRQAVATEVRTAYLDLQLAEQQLVVAEAQVEAADLALRFSEQRYEVGAATLLELTQSQVAQVRAASTLVRARYDLVYQSRLMDYYLGNLDADLTN